MMSVVAIGCVKSCGATTTALALAATWPGSRPVVLAELDPSGGDIASWYGLAHTPSLLSWVAARGRLGADSALPQHVQNLPGGLAVLLAPPSARATHGALDLLADEPQAVLRAAAGPAVLLCDCGRLGTDSPTLRLLSGVDLLLIVARPVLADVAHLSEWLREPAVDPGRVRLLLRGSGPYPAGEVGAALGVDVVGTLPEDPRGATALAGAPATRVPLWRLPLVAAADRAASTLHAALVSAAHAGGRRMVAPRRPAAETLTPAGPVPTRRVRR